MRCKKRAKGVYGVLSRYSKLMGNITGGNDLEKIA